MPRIGWASHERLHAVRLSLISVCHLSSGVSARVASSSLFAAHCGQQRALLALSTTVRLRATKKRGAKAAQEKTDIVTPPHASFYTSRSTRPALATTSSIEGAPPPTSSSSSTAGMKASPPPGNSTAAPQPVPEPSLPMAAHDADRSRRSYTPTTAAVKEQFASLRRELVETRLQLAKAEETNAGLYEGVLARLSETDRAAHLTASSLRYTGMALRAAHDNLEVELRRLLTIGLTAEEVDAAAIEAGARQYVRQNIGYHSEHVAAEPSAVPDMARVVERDERKAAAGVFEKSPP
ncbi:hypothetical protein CUR178_06279 [Leishmania enriettii]|uniref:Uncharacterized protein n=1 Tax=Leishmania enriettii TaxID=5663 RepID=A0A836HP94_LEIEN|nr:hypothetical protein CUR178_06279 [Leishmania enriettii]